MITSDMPRIRREGKPGTYRTALGGTGFGFEFEGVVYRDNYNGTGTALTADGPTAGTQLVSWAPDRGVGYLKAIGMERAAERAAKESRGVDA